MNDTTLLSRWLRSGDTTGPAVERRTMTVTDGVARCSLTVIVEPGGAAIDVSEVPTTRMTLPPGTWDAHWFVSQWGDEFSPRHATITGEPLHLGVHTGRSSKGTHPWLCLESEEHGAVVISPAWSGNWMIDVEPMPDGTLTVAAGISSWKFTRTVTPQRPFRAPDVFVAHGTDGMAAAAALASYAAAWVVPASEWSNRLPMEWNHWWPYEDAEIDESTFLANTRIARDLGFDIATCDAGWFGRADAESFWEKERGDWDVENTARFPGGLFELGNGVRAEGLEFGVWIEAEAIGVDARIASDRPDIIARRDDDPPVPPHEMPDPKNPGWLGYVCLGSPAGRDHIRAVLTRLIARTGCRWIKWDFNLDPGAGCSRTDHGHGAGDGLYEHYLGLYAILDEFRGRYPEIIWEACSSGGLRIDLGLAARVHAIFLSDPDWTEFHLQLLWGAAQMLPATAMLHFSESQWRTFHPRQNLDPATIDIADFDLAIHAVMLHRFAVSYRLPELSEQLRRRLAEHVDMYGRWIAPVIRAGGIVRPLTGQPRREGGGERFPVFQLDAGPGRLIVGAYQLDGAATSQTVRPRGIDPSRRYLIRDLSPDSDAQPFLRTGVDLLNDGVVIVATGSVRSWMLALEPVEEDA